MKEAKPASSPESIEQTGHTPANPTPPNVSAGVAVLLRGTNTAPLENAGNKPNQEESKKASAKEKRRLLQISMGLADLVLVALAAGLVLRKGTFGPLEILLCVLAVGLGAWLACLCLWLNDSE